MREGGWDLPPGRVRCAQNSFIAWRQKSVLNFELKDAPKARGLRPSQIVDFKVQMRSGLPCDEWKVWPGSRAVTDVYNASYMRLLTTGEAP